MLHTHFALLSILSLIIRPYQLTFLNGGGVKWNRDSLLPSRRRIKEKRQTNAPQSFPTLCLARKMFSISYNARFTQGSQLCGWNGFPIFARNVYIFPSPPFGFSKLLPKSTLQELQSKKLHISPKLSGLIPLMPLTT